MSNLMEWLLYIQLDVHFVVILVLDKSAFIQANSFLLPYALPLGLLIIMSFDI